jgi:hypothetical protein
LLIFHNISVVRVSADDRVKPEHDVERATIRQNENWCRVWLPHPVPCPPRASRDVQKLIGVHGNSMRARDLFLSVSNDEGIAMKQLLYTGLACTGLALQLCAVSAFAQSQPLPSAPVTTPPAAGAQPPTGGPSTPPMTEPANAIQKSGSTDNSGSIKSSAVDKGGVSPGANSFTEAQARSRLQRNGFAQVSELTKDQDGIWRGSAAKNGSLMHVAVDYKGHISTN